MMVWLVLLGKMWRLLSFVSGFIHKSKIGLECCRHFRDQYEGSGTDTRSPSGSGGDDYYNNNNNNNGFGVNRLGGNTANNANNGAKSL